MNKLKVYIIGFVLLFGGEVSHAQRFGHDMRNYFDFGEQFYAAAEQTADASSITIRINTADALFSFLKTDKANASRGAYYAVRDISIELRETPAGQTLKALNIRDTIFTNSFAETTSKETWNSLIRSLPLEGISLPKASEVHIEVRDGFLARLANRPVTIPISLRSFRKERAVTAGDSTFIGLSDVAILEKPVDTYTYQSKNWGNTTEFSRDIIGGLTIALQKDIRIDSVTIRLTQISDNLQEKGFSPTEKSSFAVNSESLISGKVISVVSADSEITYKISDPQTVDTLYKFYSAIFSIPGKILEQGKYRIDVKVRAGGWTRSVTQQIELLWHYMPLSLEDLRQSIPPLQHITTEEEYKEITSGSKENQLRKLYAFWKKQDPTPETAFNERMNEFYRRADYAYFNFAHNAHAIDGALTDRGKVYILYGPPTNIERSFLLGEQPIEIWTYSNNVKKVVKFSDPSGHGDYKIMEVKAL